MNMQPGPSVENERTTARESQPWQVAGILSGVVILTSLALVAGLGTIGTIALLAISSAIAARLIISRNQFDADFANDRLKGHLRSVADSERKWGQLQVEAQQTASVISQLVDGVIMLSPRYAIILVNPSARRLLGFMPSDNLVARSFPEVVRYPDLVRAVHAASAGDGPQEVMIEVGEGKVRRPLRIRVDKIETIAESNLLLTLRDETETRRVDEMRREFIANVSHELKTPLAAIKGYAETVELAIEDDPAAATHFMTQIRTQCLRLERLVAEMMQLARAQAGRDKLYLVTVHLGDVIAESLKSYRPVASAKDIELTVEDNHPDARVTADREATLTIINNLLGNAIRYTPDRGHVRVGVRAAGRFWAIFVSDDGVGIPESEHERIFERFYRVERTRESARGGTGLGLSIVKNLTVAQGGEVRLKSRLKEGSTFEVLLPKTHPTPEDIESAAHTETSRR